MTSLTRRAVLSQALAFPALAKARKRPNIIWISCEDSSPRLGCYGDELAVTPTINRLAGEGVRYRHAYSVAGVCAPSRSGIITGMYPTTLGSHHMRCQAVLPARVRCFTEYLRDAGYYCTNNAKTDYNFPVPHGAWDESGNQAHFRSRPSPRPFFSVFNFVTTHESRVRFPAAQYSRLTSRLSAAQRQGPTRMRIPAFHAQAPDTRRQWANFYELFTALDYQVAELLGQVEQDGLAGDTIVFFWSDHGTGLTRAKRWLYESGTHVPLIVRIPETFRTGGQARPGSVDSGLVSLIDLGPTVLNLAGIPVPEHMHGQPFLGPKLPSRREYIYGVRDRMDERYDMLRSVRDMRYRYIRNYEPYKPYYQHMRTAEESPVMQDLRRLHAEGKLPRTAAQFMGTKPEEELYDVTSDPDEVNNLAGERKHARTLERLRKMHERWARDTQDLGLIPEPELWNRQGDQSARLEAIRSNPSLDSADPASRYWAVIRQFEVPERMLRDSSAVVRVAAAQKLGNVPALVHGLADPNEWVRLHAVLALDGMGAKAAPARDALRAALKDKNDYVTRVAAHALR